MPMTSQSHSRKAPRRCHGAHGALTLATALAISPQSATAFAGATTRRGNRAAYIFPKSRRAAATRLSMSSIERDDGGSDGRRLDEIKFSWRDVLPPPPEDQLAMSGDVGALFLYSFLDHTLNDLYVDMINAHEYAVPSTAGAAGSLDGDVASAAAHTQLPVWYDAAHSAFGPLTTKVLPVMHAAYAPAISTAGGAAVFLATAWIASGYVTGAFLYRNTLGCDTSKALWVALRTWMVASAVMVAVALFSDHFQGLCDCLRTPSLGGLTKSDGEFIFSSLSVLVAWRYILNTMLGYGER